MKNITNLLIAIALLYLSNAYKIYAQEQGDYFKIKVIDEQTERGVPLVELKTTNDIRYYTDNNGIIAFYEAGLMEQKVYFYVKFQTCIASVGLWAANNASYFWIAVS